MKAALAVAAAEFRMHRLAIWSGLVVGLLGVLPLVLLGPTRDPGTARGTAIAVLLSTLLSSSIAVALGSGAVARDLAERRLSFYLARPLSPVWYWAAKMSVAFLLAKVAGLLVFVPGLLFGWMPWRDVSYIRVIVFSWSPGMLPLAFLVAAAGVAGGAVRSRSGLFFVDILMLPLVWLAFVTAFGGTWTAGTTEVLLLYRMSWLGVMATAFLLLAGAVQVSVGRLDVRRGHVWLSAIAWAGLLATAGGIRVASAVVASATPAELWFPHRVSVLAPESGDRVVITGPTRRFGHVFVPGFLLDAQGRFVRIGGFDKVTGLAWSGDGRHVVWSRQAIPASDVPLFADVTPLRVFHGFLRSLWSVDFSATPATPRRVEKSDDEYQVAQALSASGQRVLIDLHARRVKRVLDVGTGERLATIDDPADWTNPRFLSETLVRALRVGPGPARVVEWDLAAGRLSERGAIALEGDRTWFARVVPTDDWQQLLRFDTSGLYLHDLDGKLLATLVSAWPSQRNRGAGLLSDGRFGSLEEEKGGLRLRVFDARGKTVTEARLKGRFPLCVGGESAPGLLALGVSPLLDEGRRETLFVDLQSGEVKRRELGVWPALHRWEISLRRTDAQNPQPGSLGTRLLLGEDGLLLLDPATGAKNVIVRPSEPRGN